MRQRLFKAVCCIALMVSVFLVSFSTAFADELDINDYDPDFSSGDNVTRNVIITNTYSNRAVGEAYISNYCQFVLKGGFVYTGRLSVKFGLVCNPASFVGGYTTNAIDYSVTCSSPEVGVAYRLDASDNDEYAIYADLSFNGFYCESDLPITASLSMFLQCAGDVSNVSSVTYFLGTVTLLSAGDYVSSDWTASLPSDYNVGGVITDAANQQMQQQSQISQQEMQQQQQIANQQSQQSAQQHENLVSGYDNAANDSMLADKGSVLQGFEQQQDQAISSGQQHVADFSAQYDTAIFATMAPSFALVSTMFNTLWNGMGQFSTVLIIGLVLCVAGYILKLKH